MKTRHLGVLLALLILASCGDRVISAQKNPAVIKIGASIPLSGDEAFIGEGIRNAMTLALEEESTTKYHYELIFEDDKLDAASAATAANKLISANGVDAIISVSSGTGNVIAPIAQANKVIHFGIASDANIAKGEFNFIDWTPPSEEGKTWAKEAKKQGVKTIAIIEMQHSGVAAIVAEMKKYAAQEGLQIVSDESFAAGDKDFKTIIARSKTTNPDLYFLMAFSPELDILFKQMKDLGVTAPVSSIETFELTENPGQFEGYWYVNGADSSGAFIEKYQAKFGKGPQLGTPNAYDSVKLLIKGFENAGTDSTVKPSPESVSTQLLEIKDFQGALGSSSFDEEGIVHSPASVRMIKNGKPVTVN